MTPAYKGFNADWTCSPGSVPFQYEVGKTYVHTGEVELCAEGFHACLRPLDVFAYYPPTGKFAVVGLGGATEPNDDEDSKIAGNSIAIKAALSIADLVSLSIEYTTSRCDPIKTKHSTGYQSAASSTGGRSAASSIGYQSAASSTGDQSAASSTGYQSAASSTGDQSAASSTGDQSVASAHGLGAVAAAFGLASTANAGEDGILVVAWHDKATGRKRLTVGYVGEDGIKADVTYRCDSDGKLVPTGGDDGLDRNALVQNVPQ